MDNFEYSIQLNDRDWADFFYEAEECHLEEASLATADDQVLSDTDPEESPQEEGHTRRSRQIKISLCSAELGAVPSIWAPTVHNIWSISDHQDAIPELQVPCDKDVLSGSEDEEGEIGSPLPGAKSARARLPTLLPQACEGSSQVSPVHSTSTRGTQLGRNRGESADFTSPGISHNSHQNAEGSLGVKPPILENPGNEEIDDSRGEEVKIPTCKRLNGQNDIDNCLSKRPWFHRQDDLSEETSLEDAANGPLPNCNGIRRSGLLGSTPGNQTSSNTERLTEDLAGIHRSVGKAISGDPTDPALPTCIGDPLCMANPDWKEQEGPDSDSFAPLPDVFTPPEDKFTMTFPETYDFFFCDAREQGESNARDIQGNINSEAETLLVTDSEGPMSAPEIYEYFFCEGRKDDCMAERAPLVRGWCSRTRPPLAPAGDHSTEEKPTSISFPEAYEYFFDDSSGPIRSHRGLFGMSSFRATGLPAAWRSLLPRRTHMQVKTSSTIHTAEMKVGRQRQLFPLLMNPHLTKEESQEQAEASRKAIAIRGVHPQQLVIGQGDMCLVFLAFATWAVKTTDLQAPDAWKTALLANLGAVTAIRYLRRRAGGEGGRPYRHHREEPPL